jgi:hypothetical protein
MLTPTQIEYSNGTIVHSPVIQIWDDWSTQRTGYYRAFWCASPDISLGSPVIGYCSSGGSHRTIKATAAEVRRMYPTAKVYRNGRQIGGDR